jgi:hypothetical protein
MYRFSFPAQVAFRHAWIDVTVDTYLRLRVEIYELGYHSNMNR